MIIMVIGVFQESLLIACALAFAYAEIAGRLAKIADLLGHHIEVEE